MSTLPESNYYHFQMDDTGTTDDKIATFLTDLGMRHYSYGSKPHQMELLGHVFVDSFIHIFEGEENETEVTEAWLAFFAFMVFFMRRGFNYVKDKGRTT